MKCCVSCCPCNSIWTSGMAAVSAYWWRGSFFRKVWPNSSISFSVHGHKGTMELCTQWSAAHHLFSKGLTFTCMQWCSHADTHLYRCPGWASGVACSCCHHCPSHSPAAACVFPWKSSKGKEVAIISYSYGRWTWKGLHVTYKRALLLSGSLSAGSIRGGFIDTKTSYNGKLELQSPS